MEGRKGREGREWRGRRGEERARCAARGRSQSPMAGHCLLATSAIATCATPDLLFKHPDGTFVTYIWRQMKHFKHASKTLTKNLKTLEKP
jgi:hypothetical protein